MSSEINKIISDILKGGPDTIVEDGSKYAELKKIVQKIITDIYEQDSHGSMISKISTLSDKVNKLEKEVNDSIVKSDVEPHEPKDNMIWVDTSNKVIKLRTQNKWTILGAGW